MTLCLFATLTPGVKPVSAQQKPVDVWVLCQLYLNNAGQFHHVLIVLYNWHPFSVRVRFDSFEALQHLVTFDPKATGIRIMLGKYGAPDRMCMQYSACST